jgi:protein NirF
MRLLLSFVLALLLTACAGPQLRGTGDLGLIIERASGRIYAGQYLLPSALCAY